jgi:signal transduction histidine kinase
MADPLDVTPARESTATLIEKGLMNAYLAVRVVHLAQGLICVATGWRSYRRPRLAATVLVGTSIESAWLLRRVIRLKTVDPTAARVETVTGTVGILALAAATPLADRTTSLNWMLPYSVASTLGLALGSNRAEGVADVSALTATYLATTMRPRNWSGQAVTALTNAASYAGFHGVAAVVIDRGRRDGSELDRLKAESAARAEKLSAERERNRQHRMMHDSALQTLEAIGSGLLDDPDTVRDRARGEAHRLRQALAGIEPDGGLDESLARLTAEFAGQGLEVTYTNSGVGELPADVSAVLSEASREALRNVIKHAGTEQVVLRVVPHDGGVQITVRDHGVGFDLDQTGAGFGLRQSVAARMEEVDGTVTVWSEPGRGTRVTLWAPAQ